MHVARHPLVSIQSAARRRTSRAGAISTLAVLAGLDAIALGAAYFESLRLRGAEPPYGGPLVICLACAVITFLAGGRYDLRRDADSVRFAAEHAVACLLAAAAALLLQFATVPEVSRSRLALLAAFAFFAPVSLAFRRVLGRRRRIRTALRTLLVIGAGEEAVEFHRACVLHGLTQGRRFVDLNGVRAGEHIDGPGSPVIERGWGDALDALLDETIDAVVIAGPPPTLPDAGIDFLACTHFRHAPILTVEAFHELHWREIPVEGLDPLWAVRHDFRLARDSSWCVFKRLFDITAAALGLLVAAPLLLLCSAIIWIVDGGPVLYCQQRVCRDRRRFTLYKFRTMRATEAAVSLDGQDHAGRITCVGRWLRRMRLDELPQLFNVLSGDMSLIGPRAEWDRFVERYEREIPCYHFRHLVKPGITGWAQVNHPCGRSVADTVQKLTYDLYYIKNYSFLLDLSIALKTFWVMATFRGK